jgi:LuxR family maltose regulon positive regulatory protein
VFLLWLAAALAAEDPPVTLVLDDLHLLTDPTVVEGLDYVLRNVGPGLRLLVSARMDPLPLHRHRLAGELTEIRASDLAFTGRRIRGALGPARHHAVGGPAAVPDPADRGLGGRPAPGRDLVRSTRP